MDHIFGDSDDIDFGSTPSSASRSSSSSSSSRSATPPVLSQPDRPMFAPRTPAPRLAPRADTQARPAREYTPRPPRAPVSTEPAVLDTTPALTRLIAGMKSSFLPREDDTSSIRVIALSSHEGIDPLFMVRSDETTVLMGSGFGSISRSGRTYPTFPDMRLIFSEKDRIRAWILTDASIDVARFELILPTLGFPPIYATREVIASFRNSITNTVFLESCRFFELFADGTSTRRIGDIECITADVDLTSHLGFRAGNSTVAFAHISLTSADLGASVSAVIAPTTDGFSIGAEAFITGEVLSLK